MSRPPPPLLFDQESTTGSRRCVGQPVGMLRRVHPFAVEHKVRLPAGTGGLTTVTREFAFRTFSPVPDISRYVREGLVS